MDTINRAISKTVAKKDAKAAPLTTVASAKELRPDFTLASIRSAIVLDRQKIIT